jgi:hypothetical protein
MKRNISLILSLTILSSLLWMCSKESDQTVIKGTAVKGLVVNANVSVHAYDNYSGKGKVLATSTTDGKGVFTVTVEYTGPVEIVITGGKYNDEATGNEVSMGASELRNILFAEGNMNVGVTALTTIAAGYIDEHAENGLATAIANANSKVAEAFGLSGIDLSSVIPVDLSQPINGTASENQKKYGSVLAGLSELIRVNGLDPEMLLDLVKAMTEDIKDGEIDGMNNGEALEMVLTITPENAMEGLQTAIDSFLDGPMNIPGYIPAGRP